MFKTIYTTKSYKILQNWSMI